MKWNFLKVVQMKLSFEYIFITLKTPSYTDINARGIPVATSYNSNAVQFSELFSLSLMFVKAD